MPTLRLITSCSQRRLIEALAENICSLPLTPLKRESIVVLSNGMARWISIGLAEQLGVSASLEFIYPNDLLDRCFKAVLPELPSSRAFTRTALTWRIASHLPDLSNANGFEQIAAYLGDGCDDRRLLQISRALADCFDQYTIFRPEMVRAWDRGDGVDWQAQLWRAVSLDCGGIHRAALLQALQKHVSSSAPASGPLPDRVSLFGISYLPPFHLEALRLISGYCPVTCYLLTPCEQYWGTIITEKKKIGLTLQSGLSAEAEEYYETGNPLLSSFGTLGQEFFETLLDSGFDAEECDNGSEHHTDASFTYSLLSTIQNDIRTLHDRPADAVKSIISADDRSVQIHSCHGPFREMEILYDNLLSLFDEIPDLEPRHIVVMIPDIESYAPYISSVFSSRSTDRPLLPFSIADRSIRRESLYVDAFLKIIDSTLSRFALSKILDLLETPAVMSRFDIYEYELASLKTWLTDCHIRWGIDADHRVRLGFPDYADFSWQAGLDRLFLGYAMFPDDSATFDSIFPYSACSGTQAAALGKLSGFMEIVRESVLHLESVHTLAEWAEILAEITVRMLLADESDTAGPLAVATALNALREAGSLHGFKRQISFDAVRDHLIELLTKKSGGYGFLNGSITFCAMLPMRSIPMRVIWLAGMNDGQFPRTERPPGFSLINGVRLRGDRSLRDEDRYLFLEALLAAKERFCISYTGQSDRDNSTLPPSVLAAELNDYITGGFVQPDGITPASVLIRHRLQGFSPIYFNNSDPAHYFSYDRETCHAVETRRMTGCSRREFIREPLPFDSITPIQIELQQLLRFLTHPAAAFLEQRLHISPFKPAEEDDDSEPFALNSLSRYTLAQDLVRNILNGVPYQECLAASRSRGILPAMTAGTAAFDSVWNQSRQFAASLEAERSIPLEALPFSFRHNNVQLQAALVNCQSITHLRWRCAGMKGKDRLAIWLDHLILNIAQADGYPLYSKLIATDAVLELPPVEHAPDILSDLLDLYCEGMKRPLQFFPETSWLFLKDGQQKAERAWRGDQRLGIPGECRHQATVLCFGDMEPWGDEFRLLAERIYGPFIAAVK